MYFNTVKTKLQILILQIKVSITHRVIDISFIKSESYIWRSSNMKLEYKDTLAHEIKFHLEIIIKSR